MGWRDGLSGGGEGGGKEHAYLKRVRHIIFTLYVNGHTYSPRRGLTVVVTHSIPNILISAILMEYSVPACSPMM